MCKLCRYAEGMCQIGFGTASTTKPCPEKVLFMTRRGLHPQFDPEPSMDQWINSEVRYDYV